MNRHSLREKIRSLTHVLLSDVLTVILLISSTGKVQGSMNEFSFSEKMCSLTHALLASLVTELLFFLPAITEVYIMTFDKCENG